MKWGRVFGKSAWLGVGNEGWGKLRNASPRATSLAYGLQIGQGANLRKVT